MSKPISSTVHGVLDYMTVGLLFSLPRMMGWSRRATEVADVASMGAAVYSLMTRYELGVVRVLPMKAHLTLDAASGAALLGAAALLEDEDPEVRATMGAIGLWEIAAALMTQTKSGVERRKQHAEHAAGPVTRVTGRRAGERIHALQGL